MLDVQALPPDLEALEEEVQLLQEADVIILNEVDWGMPRSDYKEVIVELGKALDMNWVWGLEFVEINPVVLGTKGCATRVGARLLQCTEGNTKTGLQSCPVISRSSPGNSTKPA